MLLFYLYPSFFYHFSYVKMYVPLGLNVRLVFDYLCGDSDARHTAKFSLFGGSTWARG